MSAKSTFSNAHLAVKSCLKAVLALCRGYGKSPCFFGVRFLSVLGPDWFGYNLMVDDGVKYLD